MDLVADMLVEQLTANHASEIAAVQLRPQMHLRFSRFGTRLGRNADRFLNRYFEYPRWLRGRRKEFDLFHIVDHSYAHLALELPPERTVITCHDLDAFRPLLEETQSRCHPWMVWMSRRVLKGLKRARHVICVSKATRELLLEHGLVRGDRSSVIPNGVAPGFSSEAEASVDAEAGTLLRSRSQEEILLLNVGSAVPRKRLDVLIRVFAAVRKHQPFVRLVRVGEPFTAEQQQLATQLGVADHTIVLPFLSRPVLAAVYRRATLLLQTSESEGFGLPLVEAMACGCPVVASDLRVLREVGGVVTEFCPIADVTIWKERILQLLDERDNSSERWRNRITSAKRWAAQFSWAEAARRTVEVYGAMLRSDSARHPASLDEIPEAMAKNVSAGIGKL